MSGRSRGQTTRACGESEHVDAIDALIAVLRQGTAEQCRAERTGEASGGELSAV